MASGFLSCLGKSALPQYYEINTKLIFSIFPNSCMALFFFTVGS